MLRIGALRLGYAGFAMLGHARLDVILRCMSRRLAALDFREIGIRQPCLILERIAKRGDVNLSRVLLIV